MTTFFPSLFVDRWVLWMKGFRPKIDSTITALGYGCCRPKADSTITTWWVSFLQQWNGKRERQTLAAENESLRTSSAWWNCSTWYSYMHWAGLALLWGFWLVINSFTQVQICFGLKSSCLVGSPLPSKVVIYVNTLSHYSAPPPPPPTNDTAKGLASPTACLGGSVLAVACLWRIFLPQCWVHTVLAGACLFWKWEACVHKAL